MMTQDEHIKEVKESSLKFLEDLTKLEQGIYRGIDQAFSEEFPRVVGIAYLKRKVAELFQNHHRFFGEKHINKAH